MKQADTLQNHPVSLIFLDLNGLKLINDTFGHSAGDEFIVKAAQVLKKNCREGDVAARIGGTNLRFYCHVLPGMKQRSLLNG